MTKLQNNDSYQIISILKYNEIDVNKLLFNNNTLYTYIVFLIYQEKRTKLLPLKKYIDSKYKVKKINNVLDLNYTHYINYDKLFN
jgi:hypothetical protein